MSYLVKDSSSWGRKTWSGLMSEEKSGSAANLMMTSAFIVFYAKIKAIDGK